MQPAADAHAAHPALTLKKHHANPILAPRDENHWESRATFNPAAFYHEGQIHLLYRAIGDDDTSVIGYATSKDGLTIHERFSEPVYIMKELHGKAAKRSGTKPVVYISGGGGTGGSEDPRITLLGGRVYMFYTAYNGWDSVRIAFTSISLSDFLARRWNWAEAISISPPGVPAKNGCLLPEKVNGKYVIFHRLHLGYKVPPNILIDFVDDLEFKDGTWLAGQFQINPRSDRWDSFKVGMGATPIKTKDGWLMIYQGVGKSDPSKYKIGAMLLDARNPANVIARSAAPILEPEEWYENNGMKFGVVYPCGAVIKDGTLFVYYGGADSVVCVATAKSDDFLEALKKGKTPKMQPLAASPAGQSRLPK